MRSEGLAEEARECRRRASEFAGRAEQAFLLKLAVAFEEIAGNAQWRAKPVIGRRPNEN